LHDDAWDTGFKASGGAGTTMYTLSAMIGMMSYWYRQTDKLPSDQVHELIRKLTEQGVTRQLPAL
jgi:hypothetical protein